MYHRMNNVIGRQLAQIDRSDNGLGLVAYFIFLQFL
jgi:hypothetical protein